MPDGRRPDRGSACGLAVLPTAPLELPAGPAAGRDGNCELPQLPDPEVARLGRTLKAWKQHVLAYFDTVGVSNGGTEAINLIIEEVRRLGHGFRHFGNYRLRILLAASGQRAYRTRPNHT